MNGSSPTKRRKLPKSARLCSKTAIDALFASGKGALAYPLRLIALPAAEGAAGSTQFFVSVPKKRLRHAVDRVRMRRRIREAYRLNRADLNDAPLNLAIIYVADRLLPYSRIEAAMVRLLAGLRNEEAPKSDS